MNANQIVRELVAQAAMEIIVGKTDVHPQEIIDCWDEDKHHLAALPLYPTFASLNFESLLIQFDQLYGQLLQLAMKARDVGPLIYYVVLRIQAHDRNTYVTTLPDPDDKILFQTESENEAETWRWENCDKVGDNQPPEDLTCSTS
jgi:hypothetical protein